MAVRIILYGCGNIGREALDFSEKRILPVFVTAGTIWSGKPYMEKKSFPEAD